MIQLKNVSKSYFGNKIVDDLSLSINKGEVFGFLGPNGAGKTTTIKMLVGLNRSDSGEITIDNNNPAEVKTRRNIGFMPENPYFYDHLSGSELLRYCDNLSGNFESHAKYQDLLEKVGLGESADKMVKNYSKGMKQRLGLASAIVNNPDYIFLDEPLDGLDPIGRIEIKKLIKELKNQNKTIFFNSHILSDVEEICDQIGIINKGKLIYQGDVKNFRGKQSLEEAFVAIINKQDTERDKKM